MCCVQLGMPCRSAARRMPRSCEALRRTHAHLDRDSGDAIATHDLEHELLGAGACLPPLFCLLLSVLLASLLSFFLVFLSCFLVSLLLCILAFLLSCLLLFFACSLPCCLVFYLCACEHMRALYLRLSCRVLVASILFDFTFHVHCVFHSLCLIPFSFDVMFVLHFRLLLSFFPRFTSLVLAHACVVCNIARQCGSTSSERANPRTYSWKTYDGALEEVLRARAHATLSSSAQ